MKGKRLVLSLAVAFALILTGGLAACAPGSGTAVSAAAGAGRSEHIENTVRHTIPCIGYAFASSGSKLRAYSSGTVGVGGFPGSYGAQLATGSLERTVYNAMVSHYVKSRKTGSVKISCKFAFSGTGDYEDSEEYQEAEADISYALETACSAFVFDYPELFWIEDVQYTEDYFADVTYGDKTVFSGSFTAVTLSFTEVYTGASKDQLAFSTAVSRAKLEIMNMRKDTTQYQTLKAVHDYVCEKIVYPNNYGQGNIVPVYHSSAGVFLKGGVAVCEGYAKSFMILCREFNIPVILVVGDVGEAHMWNYVQLQGSWYAVDTTWDDIEGGAPGSTYFMIGSGTSVPGGTFGTTRVLNTCFSASGNGRNFCYPVLSGAAYQKKTVHVHSWSIASETLPTCTKDGKITYKCSSCGEKTTSKISALGHSFHNKKYVYNNDATVFRDGTKSLVCDNGCGKKKTTVTAEGTKLKAKIKLNVSSLKLKTGQSTSALKVSGLAKGDSIKSWKSTDTKIVKVSSSGKITAQKKTGTAKIRITLKSGLSKTVKVTVQAKDIVTSRISGVSKSITMKKGKSQKLSPVITPITSTEKVTYQSSDKKIVTVSASGKIKAQKKGKATITVKSGKKTIKCTIIVK